MSKNLRKVFTTFDGDTKEIARLTARFGYDGFAKRFFELDKQRQECLASDELEEQQRAPNVKNRLVRAAEDDKKHSATVTAGRMEKDNKDVKHDAAKALFQPWCELLEDVAEYQNAGVVDPPRLAEMIGKHNAFLKQADTARSAVKDETLGSVRFKDSIKKIDALKQEAEQARDDLGRLFEAASKLMTRSEQEMVPSSSDLEDVDKKMKELNLTPSQAWALVGAGKKGADEQPVFRAKALQRLEEFNRKWGTGYADEDLDPILRRVVNLDLATNYTFSKSPGENTNSGVSDKQLKDLLMAGKNFKNLWEIGASQASTDKYARGNVEEQMGYSTALNRQKGERKGDVREKIGKNPDDPTAKPEEQTFNPKDNGEMPKYAGLVSESQGMGVAERYGKSFVIWKEKVRERVTHTPGDSWNKLEEGVKFFTSGKHPDVLFANGDETLLRLAAAEALGQDQAWLKKFREDGGNHGGGYFETQIHGDLTWADVKKVVIDTTDGDAKAIAKSFREFAKKDGYDFTVEVKGGGGGDEQEEEAEEGSSVTED